VSEYRENPVRTGFSTECLAPKAGPDRLPVVCLAPKAGPDRFPVVCLPPKAGPDRRCDVIDGDDGRFEPPSD